MRAGAICRVSPGGYRSGSAGGGRCRVPGSRHQRRYALDDARPFELAALLGKVPEIPEELGKMPLPDLPICEIVLLGSLDALPTGPVDVVLSSGERWHLAP